MRREVFSAISACSAVSSLCVLLAAAQPPAATPTQDLAHPQNTNVGIYAFTGRCASCHDTGKDGATDRHALSTPVLVRTEAP